MVFSGSGGVGFGGLVVVVVVVVVIAGHGFDGEKKRVV